ncbi:MAG: NYN domain-containing protein [Chloroflexi bacterium]|nr:NYN domain-containing protein [Chloroflexota bacterium]
MAAANKSAVLIDLASLQALAANGGGTIDFQQLRDRLTGDATLVRATAYGTEHEGQPTPHLDLGSLSRAGYKLVTKRLRRRDDGTLYASVHVEMTVDALDLTPYIDRLTLVTTDPDFVPLIEAVQRRGVRVQVVASGAGRSQPLAAAADETLELDDLLSDVVRRERPRRDRRRPTPPRAAPGETARARVPDRPDEEPRSRRAPPRPPNRPDEEPRPRRAAPPPPPPPPESPPPPPPTAAPEPAAATPAADPPKRRERLTALPGERLSGRAGPNPDAPD